MTEIETIPTDVTPLRVARKVAIAVIEMTVLSLGIALFVLSGPAAVVVTLGLAILANEFFGLAAFCIA